jgi:hypothetical protein
VEEEVWHYLAEEHIKARKERQKFQDLKIRLERRIRGSQRNI